MKRGGLAVPDFFYRYFLVGHLVFDHRWLAVPDDDAAIALEAAIVGFYEALMHFLKQGSIPHYHFYACNC